MEASITATWMEASATATWMEASATATVHDNQLVLCSTKALFYVKRRMKLYVQ